MTLRIETEATNNQEGRSKPSLKKFTADELKQSLLASHELNEPVEDLIATGEAVFEFIRRLKMKKSTKSAFYQLEKKFEFYKNLVLMQTL